MPAIAGARRSHTEALLSQVVLPHSIVHAVELAPTIKFSLQQRLPRETQTLELTPLQWHSR